jgi:Na+/serine symporter
VYKLLGVMLAVMVVVEAPVVARAWERRKSPYPLKTWKCIKWKSKGYFREDSNVLVYWNGSVVCSAAFS